jgi:hypothetical protein
VKAGIQGIVSRTQLLRGAAFQALSSEGDWVRMELGLGAAAWLERHPINPTKNSMLLFTAYFLTMIVTSFLTLRSV